MDMFTKALIGPLFVIVFCGFWCAITVLAARIGGWSALAVAYRHDGAFTGERWRFEGARFGWASYRGALNVGANSTGLHLRPIWPFRVAHPPLFIPWRDVSMRRTRFIFTAYEISFEKVPAVRMQVSARLGERLLQAAGGQVRVTE